MGRNARKIRGLLGDCAEDIFFFCKALNFEPTFQQAWLLKAVQARIPQIACKSGQGPGKTTVSGIVALWRCLQSVDSLGVVTAPTLRQCKDIWLAELRRTLRRADPWIRSQIEVQKMRVVIGGRPDWGITVMTAVTEEKSQGFHEENLFVICEEASGIPRGIITQFEGTLSNQNSLLMLIGNPNTRDCAFFDCFHSDKHNWETMTFNAEETPESKWFSKDRNRKIAEKYGADSDVYRVRVRGEFPHEDPNCVISGELLEQIYEDPTRIFTASLHKDPRTNTISRQFGVDFARFGSDESAIYRRTGLSITQWDRFAKQEPSDIVLKAFKWQRDAGWKNRDCSYVADAGGMGQGVMHMFYDAEKRIHEFHTQGKPSNNSYFNKMTEAWFQFASLLKQGLVYLPNDKLLHQQLSTRQYYLTKKGKIVLETKDEYKKRGNESPDRADASMMSFYEPSYAGVTELGGATRVLGLR